MFWFVKLTSLSHKQDNLSRGNLGAVKVLQGLFPEPGRLQFIYADLGDAKAVILHIPNILFEYLWVLFFKPRKLSGRKNLLRERI